MAGIGEAAAPAQPTQKRLIAVLSSLYHVLASDDSESDSEYESDSECHFHLPKRTPEQQQLLDKYLRQVKESEGFEFEPYDDPWLPLKAVPHFRLDQSLVEDLNKYSTKAIELYNSEHGENYVFKEVERVNEKAVDGAYYLITFSAYNCSRNEEAKAHLPSSSSIKSFRTSVYQPHSDPNCEHFDVLSCELKPLLPPPSPSCT